MHVLFVYVLKLPPGFFWVKIWLFSVKTGWQPWVQKQKNTWVEIRQLEISFAPRCHWTRGNLPVHSTW